MLLLLLQFSWKRGTLYAGVSLYNSTRDRFPSLIQNLVVGSLNSYFQLTYQFDFSHYFTEATALHYYRESTFLTPPWWTLAARTLKSISFQIISVSLFASHVQLRHSQGALPIANKLVTNDIELWMSGHRSVSWSKGMCGGSCKFVCEQQWQPPLLYIRGWFDDDVWFTQRCWDTAR